jgi:putative ABC transport system permease protein
VRPLSDLVDRQLASNRFALALLGVFAGSAGALAIVGLYGLVSYSVSQRRREVGIRVALGAGRARIMGLVLGQGARLAAAGVALGLLAALALTRLLGSLLFGVSPLEPTVLAAAAGGLGLAGSLAGGGGTGAGCGPGIERYCCRKAGMGMPMPNVVAATPMPPSQVLGGTVAV